MAWLQGVRGSNPLSSTRHNASPPSALSAVCQQSASQRPPRRPGGVDAELGQVWGQARSSPASRSGGRSGARRPGCRLMGTAGCSAQWRDHQHPTLIAILDGHVEVVLDPSGVELLAEGVRTSLLANRAPRTGGPEYEATGLVCRLSDRATWAGSPAASHRPGKAERGLRAGRAAGQRQRRREGAGDHLAIAAQGLHPPPPRHASAQPAPEQCDMGGCWR